MSLRRLVTVAAATTVTLLLGMTPAVAGELDDYLAEAADAEYAGRRIIVTNWDGESTVGVFEFAQTGGVAVVRDGEGQAMVAEGRLAAGDGGVILPEWSAASLGDRYETEAAEPVKLLGRQAHAITVNEDGRVRASIVFDDATGAPLATEVYDGDGELFRYTAMLDFDPSPVLVYAELTGTGYDLDVMSTGGEVAIVDDAGGYVRTDAYEGPDGTAHAFFTDGLFSFSVFQVNGNVHLPAFDDAQPVEAGGHRYQVLVEPAEVWVAWRADDMTFVLVGDLPPDHLEQVLDDLPAPNRPGVFKRLWRGIFG